MGIPDFKWQWHHVRYLNAVQILNNKQSKTVILIFRIKKYYILISEYSLKNELYRQL